MNTKANLFGGSCSRKIAIPSSTRASKNARKAHITNSLCAAK